MTVDIDPKNRPPTAQTGQQGRGKGATVEGGDEWLALARNAFYSSTNYIDANYRKAWEDGIRAFNNQHPSDSKYNQPAFDKRSKIYRPKIRAVIRKNEAAAAAAFFSNVDVVNIDPQDQTNKAEVASAAVMKEIIQYRLTKSISWYQIVLGGLQDAQVSGAVCGHVYWEYEEDKQEPEETATAQREESEYDEEYPEQSAIPEGALVADGSGQLIGELPQQEPAAHEIVYRVVKDRPQIDLIPIENVRFDPAASWIDPVNTSPYFIHIIPMYVMDVKEKMAAGEWFSLSDSVIASSTEIKADSTRATRNTGRDDPAGSDNRSVDDYAIVWVQRHIHRRGKRDWEFYTLGDIALLTEPEPAEWGDKRPYVIGSVILETHKTMPTSVANLGKGLTDEINEVVNQRLDNVKFVLNKKWFVKRGKEADVPGLIRNVPGGVVILDDPANDVKEINWPDVTASSFEEHRNLSNEMDELLGNFNPAALMQQGSLNAPARNMAMLSQSNGTLVEYLIRTYVETFIQPILRLLVQLEQQYETDEVVMKIAAKRAQVFQRYNIDEVTDSLLEKELTLSVNVGMGATDPVQKLNKFITGMSAYMNMLKTPMPGIDMKEVGKEIFGHLGYSDGSRFFNTDNPQMAQMQAQLQNLTMQLSLLKKDKTAQAQAKIVTSREKNQTDIVRTQIHESNENKRALATHFRALMETGGQ